MTAGNNRAFVNIDTVLNYELYRPVVLLRTEESYLTPAIVSVYCEFSNVSDDWSYISGFVPPLGDLNYISANWSSLSDTVSAAIFDGISSTPMSVLYSNIVTEQRTGKWLKTGYLSYTLSANSPETSAMAAVSCSENVILNEIQKYYGELSDGHHMYIALYPPGFDSGTMQRIYDFNNKHKHFNRTFVLDTNLASRTASPGFDGGDSR